jgi:hypothetical protein
LKAEWSLIFWISSLVLLLEKSKLAEFTQLVIALGMMISKREELAQVHQCNGDIVELQ